MYVCMRISGSHSEITAVRSAMHNRCHIPETYFATICWTTGCDE